MPDGRTPQVGDPAVWWPHSDGPPRPALILRISADNYADLVTFRDQGTEVKAEMEYAVPLLPEGVYYSDKPFCDRP